MTSFVDYGALSERPANNRMNLPAGGWLATGWRPRSTAEPDAERRLREGDVSNQLRQRRREILLG